MGVSFEYMYIGISPHAGCQEQAASMERGMVRVVMVRVVIAKNVQLGQIKAKRSIRVEKSVRLRYELESHVHSPQLMLCRQFCSGSGAHHRITNKDFVQFCLVSSGISHATR